MTERFIPSTHPSGRALKPSLDDGANRLLQFEDERRFVVRYIPMNALRSVPEYQSLSASAIEHKIDRLFAEIQGVYHINSSISIDCRPDERGEDSIFITTDRVTPITRKLLVGEERRHYLAAYQELFENLVLYLEDKSAQGGDYLSDIFTRSQYMYGRKEGDTGYQLYLIDTDPWMRSVGDKSYLSECIKELHTDMKKFDRTYTKDGVNTNELQERCATLLTKLTP